MKWVIGFGIDNLERYIKYFGLGKKTGVELEGESAGFAAGKDTAKEKGEEWTEGGTYSAAIGQSYNSFTPLQLAKYVAIVANDGKQVNPTLIKSVINSTGTAISKEIINKELNNRLGYEFKPTKNINFKKQHLDRVHRGMWRVTSRRWNGSMAIKRLTNRYCGKNWNSRSWKICKWYIHMLCTI